MARIEPIRYDAFVELFYMLSINPFEFKKLYGEKNTIGFYPDLPERRSKVNLNKLVDLMK